jgi:hypothetical protein
VATVLPLRDPEFRLTATGEARVGDRTAEAVTVSRTGHRDVRLYFDKETGRLLKKQSKVKDLAQGGQEVTEEVLYEDYRDMDGVPRAAKQTLRWDGRRILTLEVTEYKSLPKADDRAFGKP